MAATDQRQSTVAEQAAEQQRDRQGLEQAVVLEISPEARLLAEVQMVLQRRQVSKARPLQVQQAATDISVPVVASAVRLVSRHLMVQPELVAVVAGEHLSLQTPMAAMGLSRQSGTPHTAQVVVVAVEQVMQSSVTAVMAGLTAGAEQVVVQVPLQVEPAELRDKGSSS